MPGNECSKKQRRVAGEFTRLLLVWLIATGGSAHFDVQIPATHPTAPMATVLWPHTG